MLPSIHDVARKRKSLGITQKDLARLAMVSQSFIAKLESGTVNPSYSNVKAVFDALESLEADRRQETVDKFYYHKRIVSLSPGDFVVTAAKLMKKYKIHQLPVFSGSMPIGSVTHRTIIDNMITKGVKDFGRIKVKDVMDEPFPIVQANSPLSVVSELLKHNHAVLIAKKAKIVGIVTKSDFIKSIK